MSPTWLESLGTWSCSRPAALLLALLVVPYLWWWKNSRLDLPTSRRPWALTIRLVILGLLVLAVSGLRLNLPRDRLSVIFLLDSSASISPGGQARARQMVRNYLERPHPQVDCGVILFAADAYLEADPLLPPAPLAFSTLIDPAGTDLARAIELGLAAFPPYASRRLVIISDGNQTRGDALSEAGMAAAQGVEIWTREMESTHGPEVWVESIDLPLSAASQAPFDIRVMVGSRVRGKAMLHFSVNGLALGSRQVELHPGRNVFFIPQRISEGGRYLYQVMVECPEDTIAVNNRAQNMVVVQGRPRLLHLGNRPADQSPLVGALRAQGLTVDAAAAMAMPVSLADLSRYQAVILNDVPAYALSAAQLAMLRSFVQDLGGGLAMVGGENGFGAGGYYHTPVEEVLPVSMDIRHRRQLPSVALVICIDKSGSMASTEHDVQKVILAREAALVTLELLGDNDLLGVLGFDSAAKWVAPLQFAANKDKIASQVATLRAGGGTDMYPALLEACTALNSSSAVLKHIIVLSDGNTEPGDFDSILRQVKQKKITLSAVALGQDADIPFMDRLARGGDGRLYITNDLGALPRIFTRDTMLASRSALREFPFRARPGNPHPVTRGIALEGAPELRGYVVTSPKSRATIALQAPGGDPLLACWRSGLGKSLAFTSDEGHRWAGAWTGWKGFSPLWSQGLRWVLPDVGRSPFISSISFAADWGTLVVEERTEAATTSSGVLRARGTDPAGRPISVTLLQTASNRFEGHFPAAASGYYMFSLADEAGNPLPGSGFGASRPSPAEYRSFGTNNYLLHRLAEETGGRVMSAADDPFIPSRRRARVPREAWPILVALALALFPLDIALRRVFLPEDWLTRLRKRWGRYRRHIPPAGSPTLTRLGAVKRGVREQAQRHQAVPGETLIDLMKKQKASTRPEPTMAPLTREAPPAPPSPASPADTGGVADGLSTMERLKKARREGRDSR